MQNTQMITIDANEAVASVAHRLNEVIAIYPITPSSVMGELADEWSSKGKKNIWGIVPKIMEMQSEAGAIGTVHGSLEAGALTTTFTSSQGLLLMIPNLYKIAGELTPFCMHVAARSIATHALSIFGDHADVMACRQTGFAQLSSNNVQEAHDMACIAQAATLKTRVPFMHFFDGFRTSHEVSKMCPLSNDDLAFMIDETFIAAHRDRSLSPDHPTIRGTAQNPDTFFQAREACNPFYLVCPDILQDLMDQFAKRTGRAYHLFDYIGDPNAERVIVIMGSGAETVSETVNKLKAQGERVGVLKVHLYRPFSLSHFVAALPKTVKSIAALDRTKEAGSLGEPLYQDMVSAINQAQNAGDLPNHPIRIIGGRYGLSSKEFTPAMVKSVFDELTKPQPKHSFTVGIYDDMTNTSLTVDESFTVEHEGVVESVFFGLGSDGTVGANKNSIKIIGEGTPNYAQGYFVYDSKKSGAMTISHLRFGPKPINSPYLISKANFVACHQFTFMEQFDVLGYAADGATFLINAPYEKDEVWNHLTRQVQQTIIDKKLKCYAIDAAAVARDAGMGNRINTVMQACFFGISGVLPQDEAIAKIKQAIEKTYSRKGEEVVRRNFEAVDAALAHLHAIEIPAKATSERLTLEPVSEDAPDFVKQVIGVMIAGKGNALPTSAFPPDGTWPVATTQWEKRNIAAEIPIWEPELCIQCNKCAFVCPHSAIRPKVYDSENLSSAPSTFQSMDYKAPDFRGLKYTIQVAPEDCTGCNLCTVICPAIDKADPEHRAINMKNQREHRDVERDNFNFFLDLPEVQEDQLKRMDVKSSQFLLPLFEYSGACAGCGETPYIKLMTQMFGDRLLVANATGCSSIFGGNLPTTPYCTTEAGIGPAWGNSLFEDNAEFGLGFRLAVDAHRHHAQELVAALGGHVGDELTQALLEGEKDIVEQRKRVVLLREKLSQIQSPQARRLENIADYLVRKSVWIIGGDGWAYDIGYGGVDHILSLTQDVNIMVMDTEVYSNTGGQQSKATPLGATAKFAAAGKETKKKDMGLIAMTYGHVYVASIAMGAKDNHTVKVLQEAEAYPGPSLIIAYSHCIAHGYDMADGMHQQKLIVDSGIWPLYRFDPRRIEQGKPPLQLDQKRFPASIMDYMKNENRFRMVQKADPERFAYLVEKVKIQTAQRILLYQQLSEINVSQQEAQPVTATN